MMKYACGAVLVLALIGVLLASAKAENEKPFDLVPFGYVFRADRPAGQNPPETQWLTNKLTDVVAGVMWEEHRPVQEVEFCFARNSPDPSLFILEVTTNTPNAGQDNRPTWWTALGNRSLARRAAVRTGAGSCIGPTARRSPDASKSIPRDSAMKRTRKACCWLTSSACAARHGTIAEGCVVSSSRSCPNGSHSPGDRVGGLARPKGRFVRRQHRSLQRTITQNPTLARERGRDPGDGQWHSPPVPGHRRGIAAEVSYVPDDAQEVRFHKLPREDSFPNGTDGRMTFHPNRTAVTVKTAQGSFSLRRRILIPASRFTYPVLGSSPAKPAADSRGRDSVKPGWRRGPARFGNACARCRSRASPARWTISTQPVGRSTLSRPKSRR